MWKICVENPFLNCANIYPTQQKKVKRLIQLAQQNTNVKRIIIFGSSVTNHCHIDSDVDTYIEIEEETRIFTTYLGFACDLWTNYTVDNQLQEEIEKTGVVVYERNVTG